MGCTDLEACLHADISKQTLYNYQRANPEFVDRKDKLKQNPFLVARTTILKGLGDDHRHALDFMKVKKKDEFSPRQEMTGKDGDAIELKMIDLLGEIDGRTTGLPGDEE